MVADPSFPLELWKHILNLLRASPSDPTISVWQAVHGRPWD